MAARFDRVVVVLVYGPHRGEVFRATGNQLSGMGVELSGSFLQQLVEARSSTRRR